MIDSCRARQLEAGLAVAYSMPSDLMTSSMKSDPGRSLVSTSTREGADVPGAGSGLAATGAAVRTCAASGTWAAIAALAAAPFKKPRRSTGLLPEVAMEISSRTVVDGLLSNIHRYLESFLSAACMLVYEHNEPTIEP